MCKLHFPTIIKTIGFAFLSFFLFQWLKQAISQLWFATTSTYDTRIQHRYSKDTAGTQILHKTCEASNTTWHDNVANFEESVSLIPGSCTHVHTMDIGGDYHIYYGCLFEQYLIMFDSLFQKCSHFLVVYNYGMLTSQ